VILLHEDAHINYMYTKLVTQIIYYFFLVYKVVLVSGIFHRDDWIKEFNKQTITDHWAEWDVTLMVRCWTWYLKNILQKMKFVIIKKCSDLNYIVYSDPVKNIFRTSFCCRASNFSPRQNGSFQIFPVHYL